MRQGEKGWLIYGVVGYRGKDWLVTCITTWHEFHGAS
jgi:hypothetical protein